MAAADFFDRGWDINPHGVAYVMGNHSWTFTEAGELSCRIGNALIASNLPAKSHVAVLSPNDPVAWLCVVGSWRAGMAWVPLNPASRDKDNQELLSDFDCRAVFYHSSQAATIAAIRDRLPQVELFISIDNNAVGDPILDDWVRGHPTTRPATEIAMEDVLTIAPTGGTTGRPKGVMNTHRSFATSWANMMIAFQYGAGEAIVNLAAAPMTHASGIISMPATARGGTVIVLPKPAPAALLDAISDHKVTELFLPPTVIYRLLDHLAETRDSRSFESLKYFIYGAAPMSSERLRAAADRFGQVMTHGYGQQEAPVAISFLRPEEHTDDSPVGSQRWESCGRPSPLVTVDIRDDNDRSLPAGKTGEICVRGDQVMKGYYKMPEQTADTIVDGWLHTGDVGHRDHEGYLYITDRKKDMIISGGFNVYPSEVEQVVWMHSSVADCAVVGIPDDTWGERVAAFVELKRGGQVTADELITWCKERLGSIRTPKTVEFVPELPRSVNGKVSKKEIRDHYWHLTGRNI